MENPAYEHTALAAKTHRTAAQLKRMRRHQLTEPGLFCALIQRTDVFSKTRAPVGVGE
jgi:hypothetical protein